MRNLTKITRITTQKKNKNRYNIFLNDGQGEKYGFSVDEAILVEYRLHKDQELSEQMIATLIQKDTLHKSYTQVINYLSYRMRTKQEVYNYLIKKEVDEEHITKIIDKLIKERLIDDEQFAESFVRTRIQTSDKGPMLVKKELIEKGVLAAIASQAIGVYTYEIQYEKALKWAEKRLNRTSKHSFRKQAQQIQATLMQKGFTQEVTKDIGKAIQEEKDGDAEWEALVHHGEKLLRKHQKKLSGYELRNKMTEGLFRNGFSFELINQYVDDVMES